MAMPKTVALVLAFLFGGATAVAQTHVQPVLGFPEQGLDDPAAYQGYQTRFFRDTKGNVVQVYLDARSGRVVNLLADAVDESAGFTVRDGTGKPIRLEWGSPDAIVSQTGNRRTIEYRLVANAPQILIGWFLLGSMRVERDLQYSGRHLQPFDWPTFRLREQEELIANLDRLDPAERQRQIGPLGTGFTSDLRARLEPDLLTTGVRERRGVSALQTTLDGKTNLQLDLIPDPGDASILVTLPVVSITANANRPIRLTVRVTTDGPPLTPLTRDQIFTSGFLRFLNDARVAADRARGNARRNAAAATTVSRYRQLERDVRGTELLSSTEKLMAGLPNYATYFGRDMMMTSLMMQPVWTDAMPEFVIASALRKLGPEGDVSHEEALGGQAIRENAGEYNAHMSQYFRLRQRERAAADTALRKARALLVDLQKVRENYHMRDDEFQLPVVVARYLTNPAVSSTRKHAFLVDSSDGRGPRIGLLLRELALVATLAAPYARDPVVQNLVASPRLDATHWRSISWRDSNAGYANGRFEMDINAIWAPRALESISQIVTALHTAGFDPHELVAASPSLSKTPLRDLLFDPAFFQRAIHNWRGAVNYFVVTLTPEDIRMRVQQKLAWLPAEERAYWRGVLAKTAADSAPLNFLAISLDSAGKPISVVNTDPATGLFLRDGADVSANAVAAVRRDVSAIMRAYPVGLFVDSLGALVANDAYAPPSVWEAFRRDTYHSPRVVWGREVNLILLGLANQINGATDSSGKVKAPSEGMISYVDEMKGALMRTYLAAEASGLKHNELWSYEITVGTLKPIRYGASTDVQLWNVTDLAVQFILTRLRFPF
ncbi:MAG: hypothetical protein DMD39_05180 [Gemmatimonadetes bacterium]|nr:MAG: hypothetical protein DMD39_05180 [Gemmatimonadota bacterium]